MMARATTWFQPGNTAACKPRLSAAELHAVRQRLEALLARLGWDERDLDKALGYDPSRGRYTRQIRRGRHPSQRYRERLAVLEAHVEAGRIAPKPAWAPALVYDPATAAVPVRRVLTEARQCAECVAECAEGRRAETDTWWWFGHPQARICPDHRAAWRRRQAWFRRCQTWACPHVVWLPGSAGEPLAPTCRQPTCACRRQAWMKRTRTETIAAARS